jgi:hypothetical protein
MKRVTFAVLLALTGPFGWVAQASASDGHVALLKGVTGDISVARQGATLDADSGMKLFVADRIVAGAGASDAADIVFRDGTVLTVGPSADVQVRDFVFEPKRERYSFFVYLARGVALYSSGMIGALSPRAVQVATPIATVGVRGTRFIVDAGAPRP